MSTPTQGPVRVHGLEFDVAALSEQGPRSENQDSFSADAFAETGLLAVADGMGGERGGRLAAETALRTLLDAAPIRNVDEARRAVRASDHAVLEAAEQKPAERGGMGCALALLALAPTRADGPGWVGAHVGDVRILSRAPDGTVRLETRDHTPAFARWEAGKIELDEIPETEGANRLQRAVGRGGEADASWIPARPGWAYLLISDGVTKAMRVDELGDALAAPTAAAACEIIRRKVEERGPDDNFTALVVRVLGGDAASVGAFAPAGADHTAPFPESPPRSSGAAVTPSRRSPAALLASLLAMVALAVAGFALWTAWTLDRASASEQLRRTQIEAEIDSLRIRLVRIEEPFGPAATPPVGADSVRATDSTAPTPAPALRP